MRSPLVFFVDDEDHILASIRRALVDEDYRIETFTDPTVALEEVRRQRPAVVVSDFYMPPMKGPDFLEQVWKVDELTVRMILTGKPDLVAVLRAVEQGAVHRFLVKPWENAQLREAVRNALLQHDLLRERRTTVSDIEERERQEYRRLLRLDAEMHISGRKGGGESAS